MCPRLLWEMEELGLSLLPWAFQSLSRGGRPGPPVRTCFRWLILCPSPPSLPVFQAQAVTLTVAQAFKVAFEFWQVSKEGESFLLGIVSDVNRVDTGPKSGLSLISYWAGGLEQAILPLSLRLSFPIWTKAIFPLLQGVQA